METNVSRRDFLKGSIVVALGAAGAATLSSCAGGDAAAKADSAVATAPDTAAKTATLHRATARSRRQVLYERGCRHGPRRYHPRRQRG